MYQVRDLMFALEAPAKMEAVQGRGVSDLEVESASMQVGSKGQKKKGKQKR